MLVQENVPLAPLTTFRIGGPARFLIEADSPEAVQEAVGFARSRNLPLFVLGGGSNLVVSDTGWPGVVLMLPSLELKGFRVRGMAKLRSKSVPESRGIALSMWQYPQTVLESSA